VSELDQIRQIAEQAYVYAYAPVYAYGLTHVQIVTAPDAERQPVNTWKHFRTLATPDFNNYIPWVNTDTVYSSSWLDLRAEPVVLTTPRFMAKRLPPPPELLPVILMVLDRRRLLRGGGLGRGGMSWIVWSGLTMEPRLE